MISDETAQLVQQMLDDFSRFTITLGGLQFYGHSSEFLNLINGCTEIMDSEYGTLAPQKAYAFIEPGHGRTSIAKALEIEARGHREHVYLFDGTEGVTQKSLRDLQDDDAAFVLIDDLPEVAASRRTLFERFNALAGKAILFAAPEYMADASVNIEYPRYTLSHIDQRLDDKLAWIIGLIRERLADELGAISAVLSESFKRLPPRALATLAGVSLGSKVRDLPTLASRIAEALQLRALTEGSEPLSREDLAMLFVEFYSPFPTKISTGFTLWVEGETDARLFRRVAELVGLLEGLAIKPLGESRDGGTTKAVEIVLSHRTRRHHDIFLLDFDEPGRHAQEKLQLLGQDVILLDPRISCSRSDSDVEIEDFIDVSCLDRFYEANPDLRPEKEIIRYKDPAARRLVVNGVDKETLTAWLEANASLSDLENMVFLLAEIRARFSLKNFYSRSEIEARRKHLHMENNTSKQFGHRPKHWI